MPSYQAGPDDDDNNDGESDYYGPSHEDHDGPEKECENPHSGPGPDDDDNDDDDESGK